MPKFKDVKCGEAKSYADNELALAKYHRFEALTAKEIAFNPATATYDQDGLAEYVKLWKIGMTHSANAKFHYA
jgi:hypothetical protein